MFYLFVLVSVAVNQKASIKADVISKTDGVLKYIPDKNVTRGSGKNYHKYK